MSQGKKVMEKVREGGWKSRANFKATGLQRERGEGEEGKVGQEEGQR